MTSRVAAKPQPPPTRTRTPMPSDAELSIASTRPLTDGDRLVAGVDVARLGVGAAPVGVVHQIGEKLEHQKAAS